VAVAQGGVKQAIAAAVFALLVLSGCDRSERAAPAPGTTGETRAQAGGTLYRRLDTDIVSLNPVRAAIGTDLLVARYLFTPLVRLDAALRPIAGLATSWDISEDGRQFTFHLDPRASFSDGTPVRASDVLFTLRKIADPASEALLLGAYFDELDFAKSRALDEHTVVIALRETVASQLVEFAGVHIIPEHVYAQGDFRSEHENSAVGSGPYTLLRRIPGKEVVLQRRRDYWGEPVYPETIVFRVLESNATAWNAARTGDLDETYAASDVWLRERNNPALTAKLHFLQYAPLSYNYIGWNGRHPLFKDKRVRRALGMALDVPSIMQNLYGGTGRAINGHFLPDQWCFNPDVPLLPHDPAGAGRILESLGWSDTNGDRILDRSGKAFRFEMMIWTGNSQGLALAQAYQQSLRRIGVHMEIAVSDFTAGWERIVAGNYDAAYLSWDLDADPDPYQLFHSSQVPAKGQNIVHYANPEADRLMEEGRRELRIERRTELYKRLAVILAEDQPYTWIAQPSLKWVVNRRVHGVKVGKGYGLFLWYPGELAWHLR
jgi:peptide/nickel transport system substrate-binding protein